MKEDFARGVRGFVAKQKPGFLGSRIRRLTLEFPLWKGQESVLVGRRFRLPWK